MPAKDLRLWAKEMVADAVRKLFEEQAQALNFDDRAALRLQTNRVLRLMGAKEVEH